jgi:hypothetical protein
MVTLFCVGMISTATLEESSPHTRESSVSETVDLWDTEGNILLLLRDIVLGADSTTFPYISLILRRHTDLLPVLVGNKLGVDVTEEMWKYVSVHSDR